ncbi:MAG: ABC transporter permease [Synergistaceae bacterium]|jgi:peptide/nickel transport system permease protein|nr:ABC transporter permease [Synergistaceae bacterium]
MSAAKSKQAGFWSRFRKNKMALCGAFMILGLVVVAVFAPLIAPYPFDEQDFSVAQEPPSFGHWFGTDEFGRDIFSRIVYASRISLEVGFVAVSIGMFIGGLLGAIAGFYGRLTDNVIMRSMDVLLAVPSTILAIAIAATLGPGLFNLMLAVGIATIPRYARIVRASVLTLRHLEFIEAAQAVGSSDFRIIRKHILPNCMAPVIVQATLGVASAILNTAGLSFIGLGIQPPTPEWGAMLSGARSYIRDYPYMTIFPGLAIMLTVLSLNFLGDGLRDALDPKLKR